MPMDMAKYPPNWREISLRIRARDGNRCKKCGVANGALGARDKSGQWWNEAEIHSMNSSMGDSLFGEFPDMIKIVLTVAHYPDPDPMNCADDNLMALCQKCHLMLDGKLHTAHAKVTRARKKQEAAQAAGQEPLL